MSTTVVTVRPRTTAKEAARLLVGHGFTALPVVDEGGRLVGIVTEADLLRDRMRPDARLLIHDEAPPEPGRPASTVDEVMVADVVVAAPDTHTSGLSRLMLDRHLRSLPVVDADGVVVGIVSRRDLLRTITVDDDTIARDVRAHLSTAGRLRWDVTVTDGVVTLGCEGAEPVERHIAEVIAGGRPGVVAVTVV